MGSYVPTTAAEREEMLAAIGVDSLEGLYKAVPQEMLLPDGGLNIPEGLSELEVREAVTAMAEKNKVFKTVLRGAGAYRHFIPSVVKSVTSREELVTCYTPYQAEISQGVLQGTFEFQTMICELTGMDVSNASHYDGATAAAETIPMCKDRKRTKAYVSACAHPQVIEVMKTYCFASNTELFVVPAKDGRTDLDALKEALGDDAACFYLQQPNYFGQIEDAKAAGEIVHAAGAKFVMGVNPIACAILPTPRAMGADVAVGDGQPLGLDTAFGGPFLGFMATTSAMTRKLPGRIVGQTKDVDGEVGYVLTLSAREQHIRREKASSNICSNGDLLFYQHIAGVQSRIHLHDGHTGLRLPVDDHSLDRRCPTVFRKQGCVDIQASVLRQIQDLLRQDLSEGCHNIDICGIFFQFFHSLGSLDPTRLEYRDAVFYSTFLHRRKL